MSKLQNTLIEILKTPQDELLEDLGASKKGYTTEEVEEKLASLGPNIITDGKKKNPFFGFVNVLINPFNLVLLVVILITFVSDILMAGEKDYLTVSILSVIVIISTLISFIQEERSNAATERLLHMVSNTTAALRDGQFTEISIEDLVVGDLVRLSAGDIIPADLRVISAKDLFLSQATLTGESQPIEKFVSFDEDLTAGGESDYSNLCLMGTNVVSGSALTVVIRTGNQTYLGTMSSTLKNTKRSNSFETSINTISRLLMRLMVIMLPVIFVINGVLKQDFIVAFLFALTVAVGLTPEMLPVVLSTGWGSYRS